MATVIMSLDQFCHNNLCVETGQKRHVVPNISGLNSSEWRKLLLNLLPDEHLFCFPLQLKLWVIKLDNQQLCSVLDYTAVKPNQ